MFICLLRKEKGKLLDETELLNKFPADRVAAIKKYCLTHGEWKFDRYQKDRVLYAVYLDEEFENSRP